MVKPLHISLVYAYGPKFGNSYVQSNVVKLMQSHNNFWQNGSSLLTAVTDGSTEGSTEITI